MVNKRNISQKDLREHTQYIKEEVLRITTNARRGHVTSCLSCAEMLVVLYRGGYISFKSDEPKWSQRDFFILSKGHAEAILYSVLANENFIDKNRLNHYCDENYDIGPLLRADIPGVEVATGSLGNGLGIAAGMALALKLDKKTNRVWCMLGDAECHEGSIWEAAFLIGSRKLNNLTIIIDNNKLGATHFVDKEVKNEPFAEKWESFGFEVLRIDGHNIGQIMSAYDKVYELEKPTVIIGDTIKGKGVSFIENVPLMHGVALEPDQLHAAITLIRNEYIDEN